MKKLFNPVKAYGTLFDDVQHSGLFNDSKTFVDAVAKNTPADICVSYEKAHSKPLFNLADFISLHFELPQHTSNTKARCTQPVRDYIEQTWNTLSRSADKPDKESTLLALPKPYIVPGGRFREIYYWDSYFTMLGLAEAGRTQMIHDMVDNFAYLIEQVGFIPNGNRTYYCSRSQPPMFVLMLELLASIKQQPNLIADYLEPLRKEYDFWMNGQGELHTIGQAVNRVVLSHKGVLNRHWDSDNTPRPEGYLEDCELAAKASKPEHIYRDIRAGAESGKDFTVRWFANGKSMDTIQTTQVIPVDLNCLLYKMEYVLASAYQYQNNTEQAAVFSALADKRKQLIQQVLFDDKTACFVDIQLSDFSSTGVVSMAAAYPLFLGIATQAQADATVKCLQTQLLKPGGWVETPVYSGEQWDAPNGWAPSQWIMYQGLMNYGYTDLAKKAAGYWVKNNLKVYQQTGSLLEKYNVEQPGTLASGGEYDVQDGFGWTNGVLLKLMNELAV